MNVYKSYIEYKKLACVEESKLKMLQKKLKSLYAPTHKEEIEALTISIRLQEAYLIKLKEEYQKVDNAFFELTNSFADLEGQAFFYKYIQHHTWQEVADLIGRSYSQTLKIAKRIKAKLLEE